LKILSFDLALKTGYAVLDGDVLVDYGMFQYQVENWKANLTKYTQYPDDFPLNLIKVSRLIAANAHSLKAKHKPDLIVIEDTSRGRSRTTQKLLEFIHYAVFEALHLDQPCKTIYLTNKCWRDLTGCYANDEERRLNSKIGGLKRKRRKELGQRSDLTEEERRNILNSGVKVDGKVTGRKKTKHFSIRVVEEQFGIKLAHKEDDIADALLLAKAAYLIHKSKP